jgi:hypothetical protein
LFGDERSYPSGVCDPTARIDPWRSAACIRRRATHDGAYAAWVETHAPEGTERAIEEALESCLCACRTASGPGAAD